MGSDSNKPPRPKHRFSFSGQNKQPQVSSTSRTAKVTKSDILTSLTRHAHPELEPTPPEREQAVQFRELDQTTVPAPARNRGSARGAIVIFLGGFLAVWLYGYVTGAYEIPYLSGITQSPAVRTGVDLVSSNPILFGAAAATVLLGALLIRQRKRSQVVVASFPKEG